MSYYVRMASEDEWGDRKILVYEALRAKGGDKKIKEWQTPDKAKGPVQTELAKRGFQGLSWYAANDRVGGTTVKLYCVATRGMPTSDGFTGRWDIPGPELIEKAGGYVVAMVVW